jgi:adenylate cyclase
MAERNAETPADRRIDLRIGLNLGDVIIDGDDVYGDGVNVAARLEGLAEPGGICLSESVRTAVGTKLPLAYAFLGERASRTSPSPCASIRSSWGTGRRPMRRRTRRPHAPIRAWCRSVPPTRASSTAAPKKSRAWCSCCAGSVS